MELMSFFSMHRDHEFGTTKVVELEAHLQGLGWVRKLTHGVEDKVMCIYAWTPPEGPFPIAGHRAICVSPHCGKRNKAWAWPAQIIPEPEWMQKV